MDLSVIHECIPSLRNVSRLSKIHKGFSSDEKYFLFEEKDSPEYVLRTAPLQQAEHKRREFDAVQCIFESGVKTSEPIEFGVLDGQRKCYMILRYVEGEDASEVLPTLSTDVQYHVGMVAGQELRLIHKLEAPFNLDAWHKRRSAKHKRQFSDYRNSGVKEPKENHIISFIEDHLHLMKHRPNRFQHDDFHPGNLLIDQKSYSGVIDFNRYDWGDPYHDFLKIAYFSREVSIPFCIGQIDGYFDGSVPEHFWRLYALYTAMIIFPTITWTLRVVPENFEPMMERIRTVLEDHRHFESVVPIWYQP